MPLTRVSSQSATSLDDFYRSFANSEDGVSSSVGAQMLSLLPMLRDVCQRRQAWALTSLAHLWLLSEDAWTSRWHVSITACPGEGYRVRYRLPPSRAPWADAMVDGLARDEAHACQLVAIAMRESGGWHDDQDSR